MGKVLCHSRECEPPFGGKAACEFYSQGVCLAVPGFDGLLGEFMTACESKGLSPHTLKAYRIDLEQACRFAEEHGGSFDAKTMEAYASVLRKMYRPHTVNRKMACVNVFLNYLKEIGFLAGSPLEELGFRQKKQEPKVEVVSLDAVGAMLACAYREKAASAKNRVWYRAVLRDIAVLELLVSTGIRVSELCALRKEDVCLLALTVNVQGKGNRNRVLTVRNADTAQALIEYSTAHEEEISATGAFFVNRDGRRLSEQSARGIVRKYAKMCGAEDGLTPKVLRDTFGQLLVEEDVSLVAVKTIMGYESVMTAEKYTKKAETIALETLPRNKISF